MKYNFKYITLLIFALTFIRVNAQNYSETKHILKTFELGPASSLEIDNKYGNVEVEIWDKDSVEIEINLKISEKNESRFNKMKENIDFQFSGSSYFRSVKTVFGDKYSTIFKDIQEVTNIASASDYQTRINYIVKIPAHITLKITNKYGNVFIPDFDGDITILLSNGDLQTKSLTGKTTLNMAFGKAKIKNISNGDLDLNFVNATINQSQRLNIESKSSTIISEAVDFIKINSKRDKYYINKCTHLFGEGYFSELSIKSLNKEAHLALKYGELSNMGIGSSFSKIKITSQYADIYLSYLADTPPHQIELKKSKSMLDVSSQIKWNNSIDLDNTVINGYYKNSNAKPNIYIETTNGNISMH